MNNSITIPSAKKTITAPCMRNAKIPTPSTRNKMIFTEYRLTNQAMLSTRNQNLTSLRRNTNIPPGLLKIWGASLRNSFTTSTKQSMAISAKTIIYTEAAHASLLRQPGLVSLYAGPEG